MPAAPGYSGERRKVQRLGRIAAILSGLLAALAVVAPPATPAPPALISVNPASGIPGQAATVRGRGFCASAGCSPVLIAIYGVTVAQNIRVSRTGTFSYRIRVPGGATGEVGVTATQDLADGSQLEALANFEYLVRGTPPRPKSQTTRAKPKRTNGNGASTGGRTEPAATPRRHETTPTAVTTPTHGRHSPQPTTTTAPTETVQTSTNADDHRRAAPPLTADDGDDFPVAWTLLAAACIAGAGIVLFALRTRRRQRAAPGQAR